MLGVGFTSDLSVVVAQDDPFAAPEEEIPLEEVELDEEELIELEDKLKDQLKRKRFVDAIETFGKIPDRYLSKRSLKQKTTLMLFKRIDDEVAQSSSVFQSDDELDEDTKKLVQKLYKEAQVAYFDGDKELSRDLLIQILFLHRRNLRAKKMLELGMDLVLGDYKVEDIETKYWNSSEQYFYGGNYELAVQVLKALSIFDRENPLIYERLGSAYYMMGESEKALGNWKTTLFLDPGNNDVAAAIKKTEKLIEEKKKEQKARLLAKKEKKKAFSGPTRMMGKFPSQEKAYDFASKLRAQGMNPIVEEDDSDGKWAVKVPVKQ